MESTLTDSILADDITQSESLTDKYMLDKTAQSDSLTCIPDLDRSNQSGSLIDSVANQVRFTLRDWEDLLNLSNVLGDQTIVYELDSPPNDTGEIALQSTSNTEGQRRDRRSPFYFHLCCINIPLYVIVYS